MRRLILALLLVMIAIPVTAQEFVVQTAVQPLSWTATLTDTVAAADNNRYVFSDMAPWEAVVSIDFTSDQAGSLYWWNADSTQYANWYNFCSPRKAQDSSDCWWSFKAGEVVTITSRLTIDSLEAYNEGGSVANVRLIGQRR
jgi:hypothetical protein